VKANSTWKLCGVCSSENVHPVTQRTNLACDSRPGHDMVSAARRESTRCCPSFSRTYGFFSDHRLCFSFGYSNLTPGFSKIQTEVTYDALREW
jgi:hypothetical protein